VKRLLFDVSFRELPVTFQHAEALETLPTHHADPFDRLILATASVEGLTIVTSDRLFNLYGLPLLDARQ
jgi:PIN domain nuclease of toxin-antitoxin system